MRASRNCFAVPELLLLPGERALGADEDRCRSYMRGRPWCRKREDGFAGRSRKKGGRKRARSVGKPNKLREKRERQREFRSRPRVHECGRSRHIPRLAENYARPEMGFAFAKSRAEKLLRRSSLRRCHQVRDLFPSPRGPEVGTDCYSRGRASSPRASSSPFGSGVAKSRGGKFDVERNCAEAVSSFGGGELANTNRRIQIAKLEKVSRLREKKVRGAGLSRRIRATRA